MSENFLELQVSRGNNMEYSTVLVSSPHKKRGNKCRHEHSIRSIYSTTMHCVQWADYRAMATCIWHSHTSKAIQRFVVSCRHPLHLRPATSTFYTVDREIFILKIIRVKNFRVDKFSWFRSIFEIFLRKMFYSCVKFSQLVSTVKLFYFPRSTVLPSKNASCPSGWLISHYRSLE